MDTLSTFVQSALTRSLTALNFVSLHAWVEAQARITPRAVAVESEGCALTYAALMAQSDALAKILLMKGVTPGTLVGLCTARTADALVGTLGILKAGAAFVPIDPTHPAERVAMMIEDAKLRLVVANEGAYDFIEPHVAETIRLNQVDDAALLGDVALPEVAPSDTAYVMFTSGSTGRPKGTLITHANVLMLLTWAAETFRNGEFSRMLGATSFCFDISIFEIFATLTSGGTLVMVNSHLDLLKDDVDIDVSTMCSCASPLIEVVRAGRIPKSLKTLLQCGEALTLDLSKKIFAAHADLTLWNMYGPTEATVYSSGYLVPRDIAEEPPIGRALTGERCYILGDDIRPVADGEVGELFIAGAGVARGYLGRPDLTAERFVPDVADADRRMYRTGDLVRMGADGEIRYIGRKDFQVKISGYRIELGEIEVALSRHPQVDQVAVLVNDAAEHKALVMYVLADPDAAPTLSELQAFLAKTLPHYMIPSKLRRMESMPTGPTGKIDRKALKALDRRRPDDAGVYAAPSTPLEAEMVSIVESILAVDGVGIDDSFFDLGGKSLAATRFLAEIHALFGGQAAAAVGLDDLTQLFFQDPTIRALSSALDARTETEAVPAHRQIVQITSPTAGAGWLFYLHGMYGGDGFHAVNFAGLLRAETSVAIVHPHGQHDGSLPPPVEQMASDILAQMREIQPHGPYRLGGFCVGGLTAYEIARQLRAAGEQVDMLFMISTPFPEGVLHGKFRALVRFWNKPMAKKFGRLGQILSGSRRSPVDGSLIDAARDRAFDRRYAEYVVRPYDSAVTLVWGDEDPETRVSGTSRWRRVVPLASAHEVPGGHFCAEQSFAEIAEIVREALG